MPINPESITQIPLHFILCIERTGSSMLSAMINSHSELLSTSEEPFGLYFHECYKNKKSYNEKEIDELILFFQRTSEKNMSLYFSPYEELRESLLKHKDDLPFDKLCKLIYLHFLPLKPKDNITHIIDKQIKYILYIEKMIRIFPEAKFIVLTRDYHDVIASWRKRGLASGRQVAYIAEIWNISYKKALDALKKYPGKIKLVKYEYLVNDPEEVLKTIASHLNFTFHPMMVNHHEKFRSYLDDMKGKATDDFLKRLEEFHSNTLSPVTTDLIGDWKNRLNENEVSIIENICGRTGNRLGYEMAQPHKPLSLSEKRAVLLARFNKLVYLDIYIHTPLAIKSMIKKFRPNKIQE